MNRTRHLMRGTFLARALACVLTFGPGLGASQASSAQSSGAQSERASGVSSASASDVQPIRCKSRPPTLGRAFSARSTADITHIIAALEARVPALMESAEIPGLSIALVDDREVIWKGAFGVESADSEEHVDTRTVFEAASLSKPVTAFVAMRFVERGELDIDRPLHEYLPNARMDHDARYRQITPRMVLSHSSGLPNWGGDRLELAFDPGSRFRYSGEGYVYLQHVLEGIAGRPFEELARTEVFEPLGLTRTSFVWMDAFEEGAAFGHDAVGRPRPIGRPAETNAAASLLTTAGEYGRFLATVLACDGLRPGTYATMLAPAIDAAVPWAPAEGSEAVQWAMGWGVDGDLLWHWGDNGDFEAFVAGDHRSGRGFVYFANSTHGIAIAEDVAEIVLGRKPWGPSWAGYDRHDDPTRVAARSVLHVFQREGLDAGLHAFRDVASDTVDVIFSEMSRNLARLLRDAEQEDAAIAVLEQATSSLPDAIDLHEELAHAYHRAGRFEDALAAFKKMDGDFKAQIKWIEQRMASMPAAVDTADVMRLVGDYGPRHVIAEDGQLFYQRDGNTPYKMIPMFGTVFRLDGLETFRLRFELDDGRTATKIIGLYMDGSRDETPRTH